MEFGLTQHSPELSCRISLCTAPSEAAVRWRKRPGLVFPTCDISTGEGPKFKANLNYTDKNPLSPGTGTGFMLAGYVGFWCFPSLSASFLPEPQCMLLLTG